MEMSKFDDDCVCSLALGLGGSRRQRDFSFVNRAPAQLSLTLSLSDDAFLAKAEASKGSSSPRSTVSGCSLSTVYPVGVKKKDVIGEEAEVERISSRASDEEDEGSARKKLRLSKEQSALLEERFKEHSSLNPKQKQALAKQLNLRPRQVEVWFQNRRARTKLKQTEVDRELLKRCCETLTDENRRLQRELQELRALKFATPPLPLYMQIPAATLTVCPSCERISGVSDGAKGRGGGSGGLVVASKSHFSSSFTHLQHVS